MWRKFSDVWYLLTFNFICLLLQYKSKVSSWRSLQFDQGCALEAWTPLGLKMWRRKRNGRADFFRLESVRGLVRCEEKLKLRRKLRLTAPWPPDPLLKISQLLFSTGWAFHQQNPRKYLKNPPVGLMSPHITWRVHFQRIKVLNLFKMFRISKARTRRWSIVTPVTQWDLVQAAEQKVSGGQMTKLSSGLYRLLLLVSHHCCYEHSATLFLLQSEVQAQVCSSVSYCVVFRSKCKHKQNSELCCTKVCAVIYVDTNS